MHRATILGTVVTVILSAAGCAAVLLLVPAAQVAASNAPFAALIGGVWGQGAGRGVAVCGDQRPRRAERLDPAAGRTAEGDGGRRLVPQGVRPHVGQRDARGRAGRAPAASSTVLVLLNVHRTLVGVFTFFVLLSTTSSLAAYLASSLALVRLRIRAGTLGRRSGLALVILGCAGAVYSIGALAGAGKEAVFWGGVLLLAGYRSTPGSGAGRAPCYHASEAGRRRRRPFYLFIHGVDHVRVHTSRRRARARDYVHVGRPRGPAWWRRPVGRCRPPGDAGPVRQRGTEDSHRRPGGGALLYGGGTRPGKKTCSSRGGSCTSAPSSSETSRSTPSRRRT